MSKQKLQEQYKELNPNKTKAFAGWTEEELREKIIGFGGTPVGEAETGTKPEPDQPEPESKEEKTYKLTEEQLQKLIKGERPNNIFEKDLEPVEEEPAKPRVYTCKIALWRKDSDSDFGVVTDLKTLRHDKDKETGLYNIDIIRATITFDDGKTEEFEYPIGDHIKIFTAREDVVIVKEERKKMKMDKGEIYRTEQKIEGGVSTRIDGELTNNLVPMRERFIIPIITIRRKNGKQYTLPPRVINI